MKKILFTYCSFYGECHAKCTRQGADIRSRLPMPVHDLQQAIQLAGQENKHVLVQVGGNWCPWCVKLHGFF